MANMRIFISSTCYDLAPIRSQLRNFLVDMGYEPIMSDYNDVLYDPRIHTHTSCIEEVATCDMVVHIVGSRFGGKAIPDALAKVDFEKLEDSSQSIDILKKKENVSVTQLEILKAVEQEVPIFTFIESKVWSNHSLYEKNKDKEFLSEIDFPSIDRKETAVFIFEYINYLRHRTRGNSINTFTRFDEIEQALRKQWSGLFQRLLSESRTHIHGQKQIALLTDQFENLKTAILTSLGSSNEKDVARGVVRYRRLVDFLRSLRLPDYSFILQGKSSWDDLYSQAGIVEVLDTPDEITSSRRVISRGKVFLLKEDRTFYECRLSREWLNDLAVEYDAFTNEEEDTRRIIFDALHEMRSSMSLVRYRNTPIDEYLEFDRMKQEKLEYDELLDNANDES